MSSNLPAGSPAAAALPRRIGPTSALPPDGLVPDEPAPDGIAPDTGRAASPTVPRAGPARKDGGADGTAGRNEPLALRQMASATGPADSVSPVGPSSPQVRGARRAGTVAITAPFTALADTAHQSWLAIVALWQQIPGEVFIALYTLWALFSIFFLLAQRRRPTATLAWLIAFLFVPLLSAITYFFLGPRKVKRRHLRRDLAKTVAGRIAEIPDGPRPPKLASRHWLSSLAAVPVSLDNSPPRPSWGVRLLIDGDDTYSTIEKAMAKAERHLHIEYYIFDPDEVGKRWRDILAERARAGVKVRVLVDAIGSSSCTAAFWRPLVRAGGEVRLFNPLRLFQFKAPTLNFRTHRKIVVIDGQLGYTGGINVSKGNSSMSSGSSAWRDTHLEILGPPVIDLQRIFLEDWLYAGQDNARKARRDLMKTPADIERWFPRHDPPPEGEPEQGYPWVQIIDSGPDENIPQIHRFLFTAITMARFRCWITTPYFVPDDPIFTAIVAARNRGVDIRILIPHEGDSRIVTAAARTFAEDVANEGVPVYEYHKRMIHAKTIVIDDALSIVGTANIDNRSFRLNFEVIAAIYHRETTQDLAEHFLADQAEAKPLDPNPDKQSIGKRMFDSAARLFAPLL